MITYLRIPVCGAVLLALAVSLLPSNTAQGQFRFRHPIQPFPIQPIIGPQTVAQQLAARQLAGLQFAHQRFPNLAPPLVVQNRVTPVFPGMPLVNQLNPAVANPLLNPALSNPFINPALNNPLLNNPFMNPSMNPFLFPTAGGLVPPLSHPFAALDPAFALGPILRGQADLLRAQGTVVSDQEQARIAREDAHQAWLESEKKRFDLEQYIRKNTPTFTDRQTEIAKARLKRVQRHPTIHEITSGEALNTLLGHLNPSRLQLQQPLEAIHLPEEVLRRVNVTTPGGRGNLGLLRHEGRFTWPQALRMTLPENERKQIEVQAQVLLQQAIQGRPNPDVLSDLQVKLEEVEDGLLHKINEVPTGQYLEAKRFLSSFRAATEALANSEVGAYFEYQRYVAGGKNLTDVVDFLLRHGLRIAPALAGDEAAYRALYDALTAYSTAYEEQVTES